MPKNRTNTPRVYEVVETPSQADPQHPLPSDPINPFLNYHSLSLLDLLTARNLYHLHLTERKGAVGTAIGRYLIRKGDSWPGQHPVVKTSGPKNFETAHVRSYSWPCVLVFVEKWIDFNRAKEHRYTGHDLIPDRLHMPDGKVVPVCVVEAPQDLFVHPEPVVPNLPKNFLGGGYPLISKVQGESHIASVGCLVTDGHRTYALSNRHVSGEPGEILYAPLEGEEIEIGVSSKKQMGRMKFDSVYEGWPGKNVYINADIGLIELTETSRWTPQIYSIGAVGPLADFSTENLSLDLVNTDVRAYGVASKEMFGRVWALFYRYKAVGGFEFVSDLLIGPRPKNLEKGIQAPFRTRHGDSGTLWLLEQRKNDETAPKRRGDSDAEKISFRPLAVQWGGHVFTDSTGTKRQPFALATLLSTVCRELEVDLIRDWGFSLPEYWGTVGHFTIANMACQFVGKPSSNIRKLMKANLNNITFQLAGITIKNTGGLSKKDFVPLADVPDLVWKMPSGEGSRGPRGSDKDGPRNPEAPNHFADMDEPPPDGSPTLLELCKDEANIDPNIWADHARKFPRKGTPTDNASAMGLLPFRVWQMYDKMVEFVSLGQRDEFICAAGTLAHYIGDACQPLHISFLHHGDPENPVMKTVHHVRGKKAGQDEEVNASSDVHEDYEQGMFRSEQGEEMKSLLQAALDAVPSNGDPIRGGRAAAVSTVRMMQSTFATLAPRKIVKAYDDSLRDGMAKSDILEMLWTRFKKDTVKVMAFGCRHLARLWESAWVEGGGNTTIGDLSASDPSALSAIYTPTTFLQSFLLTEIGPQLAEMNGAAHPPKKKTAKKKTVAKKAAAKKKAAPKKK
jgi:hypothetical protein